MCKCGLVLKHKRKVGSAMYVSLPLIYPPQPLQRFKRVSDIFMNLRAIYFIQVRICLTLIIQAREILSCEQAKLESCLLFFVLTKALVNVRNVCNQKANRRNNLCYCVLKVFLAHRIETKMPSQSMPKMLKCYMKLAITFYSIALTA